MLQNNKVYSSSYVEHHLIIKSQLVLVLLLIGPESGMRFLSQSRKVLVQNQSNCELLLTVN